MVRHLLPQRRMESSGARGHGDGGGVVFLSFTVDKHLTGNTVVVCSSVWPECGPSLPQVHIESAHLYLLALVYNLSKFKIQLGFVHKAT
jgi:hypothetical protein